MEHRLRLVKNAPDPETVEFFYRLYQQAKAGQIIGGACIVLQPGGRYKGDVVGSALTHPLLARGICDELKDTIADKKYR